MARLTAPLLSLGASGSIGKAIVFASWKGISYARRHVIPENPKSTAQVAVRNVFSTLSELWKRMPTLGRAPFAAYVTGLALTDRNRHIQRNVVPLRDDGNFTGYFWSCGTGQGIPLASFVTAPGVNRINCTMVLPTAPVGHTLYSAVLAAILTGDPTTGLVRTMLADEDLTGAANPRILNVPAGTYATGGWLVWTRDSDSTLWYSEALRSSVLIA